jgi:hypothetical protein
MIILIILLILSYPKLRKKPNICTTKGEEASSYHWIYQSQIQDASKVSSFIPSFHKNPIPFFFLSFEFFFMFSHALQMFAPASLLTCLLTLLCAKLRRAFRLTLEMAAMLMFAAWPGVHEVPSASGITTDQVPLAHCWNELPPTQFHIPSVVQEVPAATEPSADPVPLGGAAATVLEAAAGLAAGVVAGRLSADGLGVDEAAAEVGTVAKTPGACEPVDVKGAAEVVTVDIVVGAGVLAAGVEDCEGLDESEPEPEPEPEPDGADPDPPPIPFTAAQVPVKDPESSATESLVVTSSDGPGSGNCTSLPSTVVQPLSRLATKRSGRSANLTAGALPLPASMVIDAQSM